MFDLFLEFFMLSTAFFIPGFVLIIFAISGQTMKFGFSKMLGLLLPLVVLFGLWFGFVTVSVRSGLFAKPFSLANPPYILIYLLGGGLLFWGYVRITPLARKAIRNADQTLLMAIQIPRMAGAVFIVAWYVGLLPWQFAFPAAIGDTIVGLLALQAMVAILRKDGQADRYIKRTNIWGILDFVVAVGAGTFSSAGMLQLFAHGQTNIITQYPLALIPGFLIPVFLGIHLFSLANLRQARERVLTGAG